MATTLLRRFQRPGKVFRRWVESDHEDNVSTLVFVERRGRERETREFNRDEKYVMHL